MGNYMLAPEQPIENRNYAYDEDIVSDDGRIWFDFYVVYDDNQHQKMHFKHLIL